MRHDKTEDSSWIYSALITEADRRLGSSLVARNFARWQDLGCLEYLATLDMARKAEGFVRHVLGDDTLASHTDGKSQKLVVAAHIADLWRGFRLDSSRGSEPGLADEGLFQHSARCRLFRNAWNEWLSEARHRSSQDLEVRSENDANQRDLEAFVTIIRARASERRYKLDEYAERAKYDSRTADARRYVDKLLHDHNSLLVLGHDLMYLSRDTLAVAPVNLPKVKRDLTSFLNKWRNKTSEFKYLRGYMWHFEYDPIVGFCYRLLTFFDGTYERRPPSVLSMAISRYWRQVTGGYGVCKNWVAPPICNPFLRVGPIRWDDESAIRRLKDFTVGFLAESDRNVQATILDGKRCFGMGEARKRQPRRIVKPDVSRHD